MKTAWTAALLALCLPAWAGTVQVTVLARDGQPLTDAVVRVDPAGHTPVAAPPVRVTVRQEGLAFVPALTVVPVGSTVEFVNLDRFEHHVRGTVGPALQAAAGPGGFELRLEGRTEGKSAPAAQERLTRAGPVQLGCHLHGSMRGAIYVTDSTWVARTDAQGRITLEDVPEGPATVRVWHPDQLLDAAPRPVTIAPVTALQLDTPIQPRRRR